MNLIERMNEGTRRYGTKNADTEKFLPQEVNGAYCKGCGNKPYLWRTGSVGAANEKCRGCGLPAADWYVLKKEYLRNAEAKNDSVSDWIERAKSVERNIKGKSEDERERWIERFIDNLDKALMTGNLDQEEYDSVQAIIRNL